MFGLVEGKINQAVSEKRQEISNLKKNKNNIVRRIYDLEELVENHMEIESSIKGGLCSLAIGSLVVMAINCLSVPLWLSGLSLVFSVMALLGEIVNIIDSKKKLSNSGNIYNKKALLSKIDDLEDELKVLVNKINSKQNSINEYNKMFADINLLKNYQMSLGNDENKIRKTCNYFYNKPELVFDTNQEYDDYLNCNDDDTKRKIISSKILTKEKR